MTNYVEKAKAVDQLKHYILGSQGSLHFLAPQVIVGHSYQGKASFLTGIYIDLYVFCKSH